jgi:hypothetical protein
MGTKRGLNPSPVPQIQNVVRLNHATLSQFCLVAVTYKSVSSTDGTEKMEINQGWSYLWDLKSHHFKSILFGFTVTYFTL